MFSRVRLYPHILRGNEEGRLLMIGFHIFLSAFFLFLSIDLMFQEKKINPQIKNNAFYITMYYL